MKFSQTTHKHIQHILCWPIILSFLFCAISHAQSPTDTKTTQANPLPRIALVLGGGGARGAAHIGVLEVLEREHIPIACVVGTSMGGLTAGAYGAGLTPADMRERLDKADWTDMFLDSADYSQLGFRKKRVTRRFLSGTELGLTNHGLQLKPGVIAGTKIKLFFNQLIGADSGERKIEDLPIPTAIVATDIGTGDKFVFKSGSLSLAMRASMSVPGLMSPVDYEGHKLVDGGLVDNLPVEVAQELCNPDVIIAVNVGSKLKPADQVVSLLSVTSQMIGILAKQNVAYSIAKLKPQDIYIEPKLGDFSATDFAHYQQAAVIGAQATEAVLAKLKNYSVDEPSYVAWRNTKSNQRESVVQVDQIVISHLERQPPDYMKQHIRQQPNNLLNRAELEQDLIHLYGDGFYESIDYQINSQGDQKALVINAIEKDWSSDYFTFGFDINNEYRQDTNFDVRAAYRNTWINHYGGEFFGTADIGSNPGFEAEFYQPLNYRQTYFVQPSVYHKSEVFSVFLNQDKIAEYDLKRSYSEISFGKNLEFYGQAKLGWREYDMKSTSDVSAVDLGNYHDKYGGIIFDMQVDERNRLHFPSRGWSGRLTYFNSPHQDYAKLSSELNFAYPLDNFVLAGRASYIRSTHGQLPFVDAAYLGGFLNLSAYATNQIIADNAFYTHLRAERIIGRMPLGLNGDLRLGLGLEGAKLKNAYTTTEAESWLNSAVLYLGGETPLGPAYLGLGFSNDGKLNLYMQVGAH